MKQLSFGWKGRGWGSVWLCALFSSASGLPTAPLMRADMLLTRSSQTSGHGSCWPASAASPMQRKVRQESRSLWEHKSWTDSILGINPIYGKQEATLANRHSIYTVLTNDHCLTVYSKMYYPLTNQPRASNVIHCLLMFFQDNFSEGILTESIRMCELNWGLECSSFLKVMSTK